MTGFTNTKLVVVATLLLAGLQAEKAHAFAIDPVSRPAEAVLSYDSIRDAADPQVDDHLFDGVDKLGAKAKESSEVNLDKNQLSLAGRKGGEKGELAQKLDFVVVRSYEFANDHDYNMDDLKPILKRLEDGGWKHMVRTRDGREMTDICVKQDAEGVTKEMVIISAEPKELSLIHMRGNNINMNDMKHIGGMAAGGGSASNRDPKLNHR